MMPKQAGYAKTALTLVYWAGSVPQSMDDVMMLDSSVPETVVPLDESEWVTMHNPMFGEHTIKHTLMVTVVCPIKGRLRVRKDMLTTWESVQGGDSGLWTDSTTGFEADKQEDDDDD